MSSNIKKNYALTLIYNFLNILIPFISTPYIARVLGVENIGIYSYSYSVAYYFVIFAMLGLNNYGNRIIAAAREDGTTLRKVFWDVYYMQCALSLITTSVYLLYVLTIADDRLIALILVFYVISAGFDITWFFFGMEDFQFAVIRNLVIKGIDLALILILVKKPDDLWLYTLIMSLGILCSQMFLWTRVRRYVDFKKPDFRSSFVHLKPNLVLFIPVVAISIYNIMDKIMLGRICDKIQVGFYDNAEKIINIPQVAVTALGNAMLPRISNMMARGEEKRALLYLRKSFVFSAAISSACTFGIISVGTEFVKVFLGNGYDPCVTLLYFLMPMLIFKAFANVTRTQYLIPRKRDKVFVTSVCLGAGINLILNLILIPMMKAPGACIATIFAEATVCIYQMFYLLKEQKMLKTILYSLVFQVIGAIMFVSLYLIPFRGGVWSVLVGKILTGGVIYILLSGLFYMLMKKRLFSEGGANEQLS